MKHLLNYIDTSYGGILYKLVTGINLLGKTINYQLELPRYQQKINYTEKHRMNRLMTLWFNRQDNNLCQL